MKVPHPYPLRPAPALEGRAFTLVEMMISMALLTVVIGGVVYSHITGLKMYQITEVKLGASAEARQTLAYLVGEIRSAQRVAVGTGSATSFSEFADGVAQQGNAIQIYKSDYHPTINSNSYIRYFRDAGTKNLIRKLGTSSTLETVAHSITNSTVFSATDHKGVVLTDNDNNQVIGVNLEFYQIRYPIVTIGSNQVFEYFRLSSRITRRSL